MLFRSTLDEGDDVACTITNDDVAPTLTVVKSIINNDGGDLTISGVDLFIDDTEVVNGTANTVDANTPYTVSESAITGYEASAWGGDCAADGTITLLPGENKVCTITNDDVAPTLKLVKEVNQGDGGNESPDDFTLFANAISGSADRDFSNAGGSGVFEAVFANTPYELSELSLDGYVPTTWQCDGGNLSGDLVTLTPGQNVTCTIINDDTAPKLTLVKVVNNDNGGDAQPDDFKLTVDGVIVLSGVKNTYFANTPLTIKIGRAHV